MKSIIKGLKRLQELDRETRRISEDMSHERGRFDRLRDRGPVKAISAFNLFQTPEPLADRMAAMLPDLTGKRWLEPSAGLGRLYRAVGGGEAVLVESNPDCCEELYKTGAKLIQGDFLECDSERLGGLFDFVLMNPPFKQGRDVKHIRHAFELLKPGGTLIALCYDGAKQNRELRPIVDSWEVLPADTFKSEGTRASVALIEWGKS